MADFPSQLIAPPGGVVSSGSASSLVSDGLVLNVGSFGASATWPVSNKALYIPFMVETTVTAYQMSFEVTVQSGNYDVGLYDELGNRLVSLGSTTVPVAGIALSDITDTVLTPGVYYMAMNVSTSATFTTPRISALSIGWLRMLGMREEAVGVVTLPNPATFASPVAAFVPSLSVHLKSTV